MSPSSTCFHSLNVFATKPIVGSDNAVRSSIGKDGTGLIFRKFRAVGAVLFAIFCVVFAVTPSKVCGIHTTEMAIAARVQCVNLWAGIVAIVKDQCYAMGSAVFAFVFEKPIALVFRRERPENTFVARVSDCFTDESDAGAGCSTRQFGGARITGLSVSGIMCSAESLCPTFAIASNNRTDFRTHLSHLVCGSDRNASGLVPAGVLHCNTTPF